VDIAIPRGTHANRIKYPPVKFYRFALNAWNAGIDEHELDGHKIRIYDLAKTIADCFKFRNRIGIDAAREALKVAVTEKGITGQNGVKSRNLINATKEVTGITHEKIASHFVRDLRQQILIYKTSRDFRFCRMSRPATFVR